MDKTTNIPVKMGSNNGYNIGGSFGSCNGATAGVIMSSSEKFGKQQQLVNCHSVGVPLEENVVVSLQQHHHHIVGTSTHQLSSPLHSASAQINAKDVVQVMSTRNGHVKNFSSMDHHPATQNMIRSDVHSAAVQAQHHHFHPAAPVLHQHHAMVSGNTMGGVVVDGDFAPENSIFRTPSLGTPGNIPPHSYVTSSGDPAGQRDTSPPGGSAYAEAGGKTFGRKRSRKRPKTCGVCGDRAKSFHFGGLSCDSCKAFFRRSVQNDAHVAFRCAYDSCCDINISTRKSCQFCRFKKCLSIGMEKSWVMTEEERNALNQQRLEKKQSKPATTASAASTVDSPQQPSPPTPTASAALSQASPATAPPEPIYTFQASATTVSASSKEPAALALQESEYVADVDKMLDYMTADEQQEIKSVVETYLHAYKEMPFRVSFEEGRRDTLEIIEMFTTILRRFAYFAKLIPDFADLDRGDQGNLLRAAVLEMCLLRGAACFDTENNRWPSSTMESLKDCPQLRVQDMQRLVSRQLFEMHITFILHMKRLRIDEPVAMLLIMTVLFSPERTPVENKVKVNQSQEKYLMLLKKYVNWKFGTAAGNRVYPQLLTKLSDLRQLNDFHTEFHLNLDSREVNAIKKSLEELQLNPYPNWNIVPESLDTSEEGPIMSPSAFVAESPNMKMPMMTQMMIQRFADRRIPTLLDNPYAEFENDMSMIRQVQQTLGSILQPQQHAAYPVVGSTWPNSTDSESASRITIQDVTESSVASVGRPSSVSPKGYSSSTDSADAQAHHGSQQEYHSPSVGDSSSTSSAHMDSSSFFSGEYHADRFQQFLTQNGRTGQEVVSVIKELITPASLTTAQPTSNPRSQQTVLRKHSSSTGSSLPGTPSSVIRSAPPRKTENSTSRVILQHSSTYDAQSVRPINCQMSSNAGWHGGEVHTTSNGHHSETGNSASVASNSARAQQSSLYNNDDEYNSDEY